MHKSDQNTGAKITDYLSSIVRLNMHYYKKILVQDISYLYYCFIPNFYGFLLAIGIIVRYLYMEPLALEKRTLCLVRLTIQASRFEL